MRVSTRTTTRRRNENPIRILLACYGVPIPSPYIHPIPDRQMLHQPHVTCSLVVFDLYDDDGIPKVLLVLQEEEGLWNLPVGFLEEKESLEECAARELLEETGVDLDPDNLCQAMTVEKEIQNPRTRTITVVYTAVVDKHEHPICAADDVEGVAWFPMDELPSLAVEHLEIVRKTLGEVYHDRG